MSKKWLIFLFFVMLNPAVYTVLVSHPDSHMEKQELKVNRQRLLCVSAPCVFVLFITSFFPQALLVDAGDTIRKLSGLLNRYEEENLRLREFIRDFVSARSDTRTHHKAAYIERVSQSYP